MQVTPDIFSCWSDLMVITLLQYYWYCFCCLLSFLHASRSNDNECIKTVSFYSWMTMTH